MSVAPRILLPIKRIGLLAQFFVVALMMVALAGWSISPAHAEPAGGGAKRFGACLASQKTGDDRYVRRTRRRRLRRRARWLLRRADRPAPQSVTVLGWRTALTDADQHGNPRRHLRRRCPGRCRTRRRPECSASMPHDRTRHLVAEDAGAAVGYLDHRFRDAGVTRDGRGRGAPGRAAAGASARPWSVPDLPSWAPAPASGRTVISSPPGRRPPPWTSSSHASVGGVRRRRATCPRSSATAFTGSLLRVSGALNRRALS